VDSPHHRLRGHHGSLANALIAPALGGGLLYGAAQLDRGEALEFGHLFQAFRDGERTGPMLILGGLMLVAWLIIGLLTVGLVMGTMHGYDPATMGNGEPGMGVMPAWGIGGMLVFLVIGVLVTAAYFYAVPLVMFGRARPVAALKASVMGCLSNVVPLFIFGVIYIVLAILAALPLWLGFLVLGPVTVGAVYCSYREVFPEEEQPAAPAESGAIPPPPPPPPAA